MPGLVEQADQGSVHVEVPGGHRQVGRLERAAGLLLDDVEARDHLDVVDEVGEVAGPPATVEVGHEGWPADRAEDQVVAAQGHVALRVAGVQPELGGCLRYELLDQAVIEPDRAAAPVDLGAGRREQVDRLVAEHLEADLAQDPERRPVDRLDLVRAEDLDRAKRVDDRAPGQLGDPAGNPARPAARAISRHRDLLVGTGRASLSGGLGGQAIIAARRPRRHVADDPRYDRVMALRPALD